jgi:hypothetical protein
MFDHYNLVKVKGHGHGIEQEHVRKNGYWKRLLFLLEQEDRNDTRVP